MAFVTSGHGSGYWMTMTVVDRNLDKSTLEYELRGADEAAALAEATTIVAAFIGVSDANVSNYSVGLRLWNDALTTPSVGELQIKARIAYRIEGTPKRETLDIPSPKEVIFMQLTGPDNKKVNISWPQVVTYTNIFKSAGQAFISDGENLQLLLEGKKVSSKTGMRSK